MTQYRFTIGFKILSGFILSSLFVIVVGYVGIQGNKKIENAFHYVSMQNVPATKSLLQIKSIASEIEIQTINFEFAGKETSQTEGSLAGEKKSALLANIEKMDKWVEEYEEHISPNNSDKLIYADKIKNSSDRVVSSALDLLTLKESGTFGKPIADKKEDIAEAQNDLKDVINIALQEELDNLDAQNKIATEAVASTANASIVVTIIAFIFALSFGFFISRLISRNVTDVKNAAIEISKGNLKEKIIVRSRDEIGELATAFNAMAENLESSHEALETTNNELEAATKQTEEKLAEVETLNKFMVGRELRMIELKAEIEELKKGNVPNQSV